MTEIRHTDRAVWVEEEPGGNTHPVSALVYETVVIPGIFSTWQAEIGGVRKPIQPSGTYSDFLLRFEDR